jgi:hypothetical protein
MYEMLTGKRAFEGTARVIAAILELRIRANQGALTSRRIVDCPFLGPVNLPRKMDILAIIQDALAGSLVVGLICTEGVT